MKNQGFRFFLILALIALAALGVKSNPMRLGLDLAGGASLAYRVTADEGQIDAERMKKLIDVLDSRVNGMGLADVSITASQDNELLVELPGRTSNTTGDIERLIERNGELQFRIRAPQDVETEERQLRESSPKLYKDPDEYTWYPAKPGEFGDSDAILCRTPEKPLEKELRRIDRQIAKLREAGDSANEIPALEAERNEKEKELDKVRKAEIFRGEDLAKTGVTRQNAQIVVNFEFRSARKNDFLEFTTKYVKQQMAIILDGVVNSAPNIRSPLSGGGIIEGGGSGFRVEEASELTIVLDSGSTGVHLSLERKESMGPSLGEAAIERGKLSIAGGFIAVLLLMLWFYRLSGIIANVALLLNVLLLVGALAFFQASLTLPGIAGIVLTLGMAVDANILIFERIREERERGKSLVESLATGYDRAFVAIVDANVTTVLTALVLIGVGTGSVKGFGVTLTLGILASMFTAIFVTRTIFEWAIEAGIVTDLRFGRHKGATKIDFMRVRRLFTGPSLLLMALGFVFFLSRDASESKDLEFVGGQRVVMQLDQGVTQKDVESRVRANELYSDATVVTLAAGDIDVAESDIRHRFDIRAKVEDKQSGEDFLAYLTTTFDTSLAPEPFTGFERTAVEDGDDTVAFQLHILETVDAPRMQTALAGLPGVSGVTVTPLDGSPRTAEVTLSTTLPTSEVVRDQVRKALTTLETPIQLSEPFPAVSFLNASRAEQLWRSAMKAVLLAMLFQVIYIRMRFADFKHGFAAACALLHDVAIALGCVAICDASGLVHAKVNLVLVAAFLTLIGYSMNDTIVVFDRIRENMGRGRLVLSNLVNESVNQTLARSIRTSITTLVVVLIQFVMNRDTGSVLEGFAFVMVVGVVLGTYSSIFIASPLLLFLPVFWRKFAAQPKRAALQIVAAIIAGYVAAVTTEGHNLSFWIATLIALNPVIHFLFYFMPWLGNPDPDALLEEERVEEEDQRPLAKPGI